MAAHLVLTPGVAARLVVAFPAGNSVIALWFDAPVCQISRGNWPSQWSHRASPGGRQRAARGKRGARHNRRRPRGAAGDPEQHSRNPRFRLYGCGLPPGILAAPAIAGKEVVWQRRRLYGAAGYRLAIEVLDGSVRGGNGRAIVFEPGVHGGLRLRLTALTGDVPLTPIDESELLAVTAAADASLRRMLAFLSYREKLLAGTLALLDTYFGRDTLMSLRLLARVLSPQVTEAGLGAVLGRLNEAGEVAHEEDIGEYAVLRRIRAGLPPDDACGCGFYRQAGRRLPRRARIQCAGRRATHALPRGIRQECADGARRDLSSAARSPRHEQ